MTSTNTDQPSRAAIGNAGAWNEMDADDMDSEPDAEGDVADAPESDVAAGPPLAAGASGAPGAPGIPGTPGAPSDGPSAWCSPPGWTPVASERPGPNTRSSPRKSLTAVAIRFVRHRV